MEQIPRITPKEAQYLIEIYREFIEKENNDKSYYFGPTKLSKKFNVSKVTAYEIIKKLVILGLLEKANRAGYKLSTYGVAVAKKLIRRHRILETFFVETIKENPDRICARIFGLEIYFDDDIIDKMCNYLNHPRECPHGKKIPRKKECCEKML
ncbi:MAG: metal-dependent transcriptional regulator [Candidatus Asgardarchaeum sp.]